MNDIIHNFYLFYITLLSKYHITIKLKKVGESMIGMQYKIMLPNDYNMGIIKKRVQDNGIKTDGFPGLKFKAYLITEKEKNGNLYNSYAPLYVWNDSEGMNQFIFKGFFDNILESFGWHQINIGVPLSIKVDIDFKNVNYIVEYEGKISKSNSLTTIQFNTSINFVKSSEQSKGNLLIYNPDKWGYSHFSFYQDMPKVDSTDNFTVYELLHVSQ